MSTKPPHRRFYKEDHRQYQTTGEEKTRNQRVPLIQLHRIKLLNNKNN
jgi:hypothetical protein